VFPPVDRETLHLGAVAFDHHIKSHLIDLETLDSERIAQLLGQKRSEGNPILVLQVDAGDHLEDDRQVGGSRPDIASGVLHPCSSGFVIQYLVEVA
jgi:hypothetical protein